MTHHVTITVDRLRTALRSVAAIAEAARCTLGETGLKLSSVDTAGTAHATAFLHPAAFDEFSVPTSVTIGVPLDRMVTAVDRFDPTTTVTFAIDPDHHTLAIDDGKLTVTLGLLDPDTVALPPDGTVTASTLRVSLDGVALARAVAACRMVYAADAADGDPPTADLVIGTDREGGVFAEAHGDTDDAYVELPVEERSGLGEQPVQAPYPLATLRQLTRPIESDTRVDLRFGAEVPLGLGWSFAERAGEVYAEVAPIVDGETPDPPSEPEAKRSAADGPPLPPGVEATHGTVRVRAGHFDSLDRLIRDGSAALVDTERLEIVTDSGTVISVTSDGERLDLDRRDPS